MNGITRTEGLCFIHRSTFHNTTEYRWSTEFILHLRQTEFTLVTNAVVGESPKCHQILTEIIKLVYKRVLLIHPLDLVNLQRCWYWCYIAYFISKCGKRLWCINYNISRLHFTVDQVFDSTTNAIHGAFSMVGFVIMPF